jgi:hypothetical protein
VPGGTEQGWGPGAWLTHGPTEEERESGPREEEEKKQAQRSE